MAELLFRIGRFAARRHWTVIGAWLAVLAVTAVTYVSFAGALSSSITLPDTPTTRVSQQLERDFEGTGGGNATIVVETTDGSAFTAEQEREVTALLDRLARVDDVADVADPFATQDRLDASARQVAAGGRSSTPASRGCGRRSRRSTPAGSCVEQQRAQARADGTLDDVRRQLDAAARQLDDGQAELDRQRARVEEQSAPLEAGATLSELSAGYRTVSEDGSRRDRQRDLRRCRSPRSPSRCEDRDRGPRRRRRHRRASSCTPRRTSPRASRPSSAPARSPASSSPRSPSSSCSARCSAPPCRSSPRCSASAVASLASLSFSGVVEFVSVTPVLGVMLGLAVGIDYSLFIINRHRRQLKQGAELHESIGLANGTSGNAVVFAGVTVIVALLALNVTGVGLPRPHGHRRRGRGRWSPS